jgi:hypothetical protein
MINFHQIDSYATLKNYKNFKTIKIFSLRNFLNDGYYQKHEKLHF